MSFTGHRIILTSEETLFKIQNIGHVHHLAPTLLVLHLHTDEILILLTEVAVFVLILKYFPALIQYEFVHHAAML